MKRANICLGAALTLSVLQASLASGANISFGVQPFFTSSGLPATSATYDGLSGPLTGTVLPDALVLSCSGCPVSPPGTPSGGLAFGPGGSKEIQFTSGPAIGPAPDGQGILFGDGGNVTMPNFSFVNPPAGPNSGSTTVNLFQGRVTTAEVFFGSTVQVSARFTGSMDAQVLAQFGVAPATPFVGTLSFNINPCGPNLPPSACTSSVPPGGYHGGVLNVSSGGTFSGNRYELGFSSVPEPSSWILLASGLLSMGWLARRRSDR